MHWLGTGGFVVVIQVCLAVHVIKTRRPYFWLFLIIFFPGLGSLVYFLIEMLPDLRRSRAVRDLGSSIARAANPGAEVRRLREQLERTDTLHNRQALAQALVHAGEYSEAIALYEGARQGVHSDDVGLLFDLGVAYFHAGRNDDARATLERLAEVDPDHNHHERDLILARVLEEKGELSEATDAYARLERTYPGEEVRCRLAILLARMGEADRARAMFDEVLIKAKRAPSHYRKSQKAWIQLARQNL